MQKGNKNIQIKTRELIDDEKRVADIMFELFWNVFEDEFMTSVKEIKSMSDEEISQGESTPIIPIKKAEK